MWDERYAEEEFAFGTRPNDFLADRVSDLKPGRCLCLAEGQGRNAVWLAQRGFTVTAMDASAVGMERARKFAAESGVAIVTEVADLADYDMGVDRWDTIVAIFVHLPPPLRARVHAAIARALVPGGTVLIEGYTPDKYDQPGFGGPPPDQRDRTMTRAMLLEDFAGLDPVYAEEVVRDVDEGTRHGGRMATVQFLARKPGA